MTDRDWAVVACDSPGLGSVIRPEGVVAECDSPGMGSKEIFEHFDDAQKLFVCVEGPG